MIPREPPMSAQMTCPSCQTMLMLPANTPPGARIKCLKCGQITDVSRPKVVLADSADPAPPDTRPSLSKPARDGSLLCYLVPVSVILLSIFSLALPIFLAQYVLGLVVACID